MPDHSFSKEIFPNIQSKPPLKQLEAISSHPITSYLGEVGQDGGKLSSPSGILIGLWFTGNPWEKGSVNEENCRECLDVWGYKYYPHNLPKETSVPTSMLPFSKKQVLEQKFCLRHEFQLWDSCVSVLRVSQGAKEREIYRSWLHIRVTIIWFYFTSVLLSLWSYEWHCQYGNKSKYNLSLLLPNARVLWKRDFKRPGVPFPWAGLLDRSRAGHWGSRRGTGRSSHDLPGLLEWLLMHGARREGGCRRRALVILPPAWSPQISSCAWKILLSVSFSS